MVDTGQEVLGHASVRTTQIYVHVTKQEARRSYLANHPTGKRPAAALDTYGSMRGWRNTAAGV